MIVGDGGLIPLSRRFKTLADYHEDIRRFQESKPKMLASDAGPPPAGQGQNLRQWVWSARALTGLRIPYSEGSPMAWENALDDYHEDEEQAATKPDNPQWERFHAFVLGFSIATFIAMILLFRS